jgi:tetratricopeptide (TPR) repeat protein
MSENSITDSVVENDFDKLWDYDNPSETEKKFKELIPVLKDSENKSAYFQLLTQTARTLGLQMKFEEAHKLLDEVEPMITDEFYVAKIRYMLERGRTFRSSKQVERSRDFFINAYELAVKHNEDNYAIDAAHMLGIIEPFKEAQEWNELAMKLSEKTKDEKAKKWLGPLYNNTAWNYHDNKEYEKALEIFRKNVDFHTQRESKQQLIIAKWSVARALRSLDKTDEAAEMQLSLLKEIEEKGLEQDGYIYEELGELYLIKKNNAEAKKYFGLAYDLLSKDIWLAANEKDRLERLKALGEN